MNVNYEKLLKGLLLALWMTVLSMAAAFSLNNPMSEKVTTCTSPEGSQEPTIELPTGEIIDVSDESSSVKPLEVLKSYLAGEFLPIEYVLDEFVYKTDWAEIDLDNESTTPNNNADWKREEYRLLFERVCGELIQMAQDSAFDPGSEQVEVAAFITRPFISLSKIDPSKQKLLPPRVTSWVLSERDRIGSLRSQNQLIYRIALLVALGAFGALIFLTKNYTSNDASLPLEEYVFRPILGMLLAISVFVVIASTDAVLSDSGLESLREGPLLILAFAAGLMSEQVYEYLRKRTGAKLAEDD